MSRSTSSSEASVARRSSGHDGIRNNTYERVQENENRSMNQRFEMDGTSSRSKENRLLSKRGRRSVSPDTVPSVGSGTEQRSPKLGQEEDFSEDEMHRRNDSTDPQPPRYYGEKDVSDVEEDSDDSLYGDGRSGPRRSKSIHSEDAASMNGSLGPEDESLQSQIGGRRPDSPRQLKTDSAGGANGFSSRIQADDLFSSSAAIPQQPSSPEGRTTPRTSPRVGSERNINGYSAPCDEARDVVTPMQYAMDAGGESSPPPSSSPPAYGRTTPTMNGHYRQGSMMKGTPPSRAASRRSQHVTPLRDRVRYSWQSVPDEEPNRPRIHIIKLISNTATASAGFPQGEALGFSMSPGGRRLAAYNSARLYILQTAALPIGVSQDFALKRRPLAVEIVDEGNVLAILADEHTVNIYDLGHQQLRRMRTIKTDFPTSCIAISPTGGLLAAAYEGGVEIFSLAQGSLPTDRRAVRCPKMDKLSFSEDSSTLLGTTVRINVSSTMAVSVPVFPSSSVPTHEELKEAWCSELLHPENIRNSSHAVFMRENREVCNDRLFSWNGLEDTFGILNVNDMQYGATEFPVVISPPLSTCGGLGAAIHSAPALDERGDTVAMIVNDRTIRLYIVPHRSHNDDSTVEAHSIDHELDEGYGCPFSEVKWVYSSTSLPAPTNSQNPVQGRLVVTSPGGINDQGLNEEPVDDIEGGRIILFDFDPQFAGQAGQTFSLTMGKSQPQLLEEPPLDVAEEVALVRRRTVNQNRGGGLSTRPVTLGRTASTFSRRNDRSSRSGTPNTRPIRASMLSMQSEASRSLPDLMESGEALDTFEEPYAQGAPRSHASLQRAASNAQRHRFQTLEERNQELISVDASGGFLALPEYTEEPNAPLPSRFRALAGLDTPATAPATKAAVVTNTDGDRQSPVPSTPSTAPAATADTFSADQAFHAATVQTENDSASVARDDPATPPAPDERFSPVSRAATFDSLIRSATADSLNSMPRSLRRAYGNAPPGGGPLPNVTGEWEIPNTGTGTNAGRSFPPPPRASTSRSCMTSPPVDAVPEEDMWDPPSPTRLPHSSSSGRPAQSSTPYRYSTSLLDPPGHASLPNLASPTVSDFDASSPSPTSTTSSRTRRLPPHMLAFRTAAQTNASASLFPPNQRSDHVPVRERSINTGSVPHPVTAWHPPAASLASPPATGSFPAHSRKSSVSNRSAFASTAKAKKLGFFRTGTKKRKNDRMLGPEFLPQRGGRNGNDSMAETKSMFTTFTKNDGRCVVM
ncbi:uncharacterized protein LTR77_008770 [Saxophila tyrrhenica]|uniref:DUF7165 domain-containing protein n=1 Tax=Saxophila tyrrhenica TaxID=1690608 RepID=A0AAV9P0M1_9PEZI|nr:hypothetical protein LTR77_008770 [Saxophila tyrrhenica]